MTEKENAIFHKAIQTFGKDSQLVVAIEEMAELTKEITKHLRGEENWAHLSEEIADVEIMLDQLKLIFLASHVTKGIRDVKLARLEKRIEEAGQ